MVTALSFDDTAQNGSALKVQINFYSRRRELAKAGKMKAAKAGPRHTLKSRRNLNKNYLTSVGPCIIIHFCTKTNRRSQRPRGLRLRSAAARLLRLWIRIPSGACMSVCCQCCVLSGRGLCDGLITRPEESYRLRCVVVCDLETSSRMRRSWPALGCSAIGG